MKDNLKEKFSTGSKPTGADFAELINETYREVDKEDLESKADVTTNNGFTDNKSIEFEQDKRIHLKTDQKWIAGEGHLSDLIRLQWTAERAKPALSWLDENGDNKAAIVTHYEANDSTRIDHRHISIETTMSPTGDYPNQLFTRFAIPFNQDTAEIETSSSNFNVSNGVLRVVNEDGTSSELVLGRSFRKEDNQKEDGSPDYDKVFSPRWSIRSDNRATETGGNASSDFRIVRYNDNNVALDSPFVINRRTANVGIGVNEPTNKLDINGNSIRVRGSMTPNSSTSEGKKGEICYDENFIYICVDDNTWKRTALEEW